MYLQKVISRTFLLKLVFMLASCRSMTKIAGSRSITERHRSTDPDPYQNVMESQHWSLQKVNCDIPGILYNYIKQLARLSTGSQLGGFINILYKFFLYSQVFLYTASFQLFVSLPRLCIVQLYRANKKNMHLERNLDLIALFNEEGDSVVSATPVLDVAMRRHVLGTSAQHLHK